MQGMNGISVGQFIECRLVCEDLHYSQQADWPEDGEPDSNHRIITQT